MATEEVDSSSKLKTLLSKIPIIGDLVVLREICRELRRNNRMLQNFMSPAKTETVTKPLPTDMPVNDLLRELAQISADQRNTLNNIAQTVGSFRNISILHEVIEQRAANEALDYMNTKNRDVFVCMTYDLMHKFVAEKLAEREEKKGLFLEFGVFAGNTINMYSAARPDVTFYGFDSFEGLPEDWFAFSKKAFSLNGNLPPVNKNVELIKGWFDETLPPFLEKHPGHVSFVSIDCDLYSSTKTVLDLLAPRIGPGTMIYFDEYFGFYGWQEHEFKAFQEFVTKYNIKYQYRAMGTMGVIVDIL